MLIMCHLFIILEVLRAQEKMAKMALQKCVVGDHLSEFAWNGASKCFVSVEKMTWRCWDF